MAGLALLLEACGDSTADAQEGADPGNHADVSGSPDDDSMADGGIGSDAEPGLDSIDTGVPRPDAHSENDEGPIEPADIAANDDGGPDAIPPPDVALDIDVDDDDIPDMDIDVDADDPAETNGDLDADATPDVPDTPDVDDGPDLPPPADLPADVLDGDAPDIPPEPDVPPAMDIPPVPDTADTSDVFVPPDINFTDVVCKTLAVHGLDPATGNPWPQAEFLDTLFLNPPPLTQLAVRFAVIATPADAFAYEVPLCYQTEAIAPTTKIPELTDANGTLLAIPHCDSKSLNPAPGLPLKAANVDTLQHAFTTPAQFTEWKMLQKLTTMLVSGLLFGKDVDPLSLTVQVVLEPIAGEYCFYGFTTQACIQPPPGCP